MRMKKAMTTGQAWEETKPTHDESALPMRPVLMLCFMDTLRSPPGALRALGQAPSANRPLVHLRPGIYPPELSFMRRCDIFCPTRTQVSPEGRRPAHGPLRPTPRWSWYSMTYCNTVTENTRPLPGRARILHEKERKRQPWRPGIHGGHRGRRAWYAHGGVRRRG